MGVGTGVGVGVGVGEGVGGGVIVGAAVPAATAKVRGGADQEAIWDGAAVASADRVEAEVKFVSYE